MRTQVGAGSRRNGGFGFSRTAKEECGDDEDVGGDAEADDDGEVPGEEVVESYAVERAVGW